MQHLDENGTDWQAVTGRSLAYLCLHVADLKRESLTQQAKFLIGIGLGLQDAAVMLGTTPASVRELFRYAQKAKGAKRAQKTKRSTRAK